MQVAIIEYFGYLEQEELIERNPARLIKKIKRTSGATTGCGPTKTGRCWRR